MLNLNMKLSKTIGLLFLSIFSTIASVFAIPPYNMPVGVTPISHDVYHLHMTIFYICIGIAVVVYGAMFYSLIKFRKSKSPKSQGPHHHFGIEVLWTIIPCIILIVMAIPTTKVLMKVHDTKKPDLNVKITGYQWYWGYEFLDQNIAYKSNLKTSQDQINGKAKKDKWFLLEVDHPLVLPIHEKVRMLFTSDDVIHSWWVPDLGFKQDAVPGYINENWTYIDKPGLYRGQCGALCGAFHAFMPIEVEAVPLATFNKWVQANQQSPKKYVPVSAVAHLKLNPQGKIPDLNKPAPIKSNYTRNELIAAGNSVYNANCSVCHQQTGLGMPPTFPALKGSKVVTGPMDGNTNIILYGKAGSAMQAFKDKLKPEELAAVISYIRNSWGNDKIVQKNKKGLIIQPKTISDIIAKEKQS